LDVSEEQVLNIMQELESMLHSKNIVLKDDPSNTEYQRTLLSQSHNTSNGLSQKHLTEMTEEERKQLLQDPSIYKFLRYLQYIE